MDDKVDEILRRLQAVTDKLTLVDEEGLDISILVSKTQALICTNEEIWERCKPNHIISAQVPRTDDDMIGLYRIAYPKISATTTESEESHRSVTLETLSELEVKYFPPLPPISKELSTFFHIEKKPEYDSSPIRFDYQECLTSILCTKDAIARQFLIIFKAQLEHVQIAFGEIERWLLDAGEATQFINQTFNSQLRQLKLGSGYCHARGGTLCVNCFKPYNDHRHGSPYSWCDKQRTASYFVPASHMLKTINIASPTDIYQLTFDVGMDDHRERLKRFLFLMQATETTPAPNAPIVDRT